MPWHTAERYSYELWLFIRVNRWQKDARHRAECHQKFAYIPKNLGGDTLAQVCEEKPIARNRCGRWHVEPATRRAWVNGLSVLR